MSQYTLSTVGEGVESRQDHPEWRDSLLPDGFPIGLLLPGSKLMC